MSVCRSSALLQQVQTRARRSLMLRTARHLARFLQGKLRCDARLALALLCDRSTAVPCNRGGLR
jgi:hypothetical protein